MQLKSVSVENLENVLKRMFNATLEDSSELFAHLSRDNVTEMPLFLRPKEEIRPSHLRRMVLREDDAVEKHE